MTILSQQPHALIRLQAFSRPFEQSFTNLPADPYCPGRHRRFSQYRLTHQTAWLLRLLPHRPHIQPRKYNQLAGSIRRPFEPLQIDVTGTVTQIAAALNLDPGQDWQVDVHQWRTHCRQGQPGVSVPEGPHRDGHHYGAVVVVARQNIRGGQTLLSNGAGDDPFYRHSIQPGQALLFDDRKIYHHTEPIEATTAQGHRDILVLDFNPWPQRRYGATFEAQAASS